MLFHIADCGPDFGMLNNGREVLIEGTTTFGSRVEFICDAGFTREGNQFRECLVDGSWSGNAPTCEGMYICEQSHFLVIHFHYS